MADMAYINAFLNKRGVEGPCQTTGYIPAKPGNFYGKPEQKLEKYTAIGVSGVTIATGCDLGQTNAATLRNFGVPDELIAKFEAYIGLKKAAAIAKLAELPLGISTEEANLLDTCVHTGYLDSYVRPTYEWAARFAFDDLPRQAQAVIFSVCFQKGCGGVRRDWPKTWEALTTFNWAKASADLLRFEDYKTRRALEGNLLKELL